MISAKEVQVLNNQIEKIHTEKTKIETRQEMLKKQLSEELEAYKVQFGVNLEGKDVAQTKSLIEAETKKVTTEVEKEYNLKVKVVDAINKGDFDTAYELLGIEVENAQVQEEIEPTRVNEVVEEVDEETVEDMLSEEESMDSFLNEVLGEEDSQEDWETEEEVSIPTPTEKKVVEKKEENKKASIADVFGSMEMEDEDESDFGLDDTSFGFGEALKGTKFGL